MKLNRNCILIEFLLVSANSAFVGNKVQYMKYLATNGKSTCVKYKSGVCINLHLK